MRTRSYAMLIIEVAALLTHRSPSSTTLTNRERQILEKGIQFLVRVLTGYNIVAANNASLVPELGPLTAYTFATQALQSFFSYPHEGIEGGEKDLIERTTELLRQILAGYALANLRPSDVREARELFGRLARLSFVDSSEYPDEVVRAEFLGVLDPKASFDVH